MNEILLEFAGRMSDAGATQLPESFRQMAVNARFFLNTRMAGSDFAKRLEEAKDFRVNQKKGRIVWSFGEAPEVAADAQVIGTYSNDGSFMWGWGHPGWSHRSVRCRQRGAPPIDASETARHRVTVRCGPVGWSHG